MVLALRVCESDSSEKMSCRGFAPEHKDPGIKLFGRNIPAPECNIPAESNRSSPLPANSEVTHACSDNANLETKKGGHGENSPVTVDVNVNQTPVDRDTTLVIQNSQEDHNEANHAEQEKVFKKPDKILPCPRCNSLETKFCYFNNYNVNQPRHFCKNCQRYWTAGGTMRNVPVGAGRRKNKHLASQYCQTTLSAGAIHNTSLETPESVPSHHFMAPKELPLTTVGTSVLQFGPEPSLSKSAVTVLSLEDHKCSIETGSMNCAPNREDISSCVSSVAAYTADDDLSITERERARISTPCGKDDSAGPMQFYPVPACYVPLSPGWQHLAASYRTTHYSTEQVPSVASANSVQLCPAPMIAVPGTCPPSIPLHILPAPYFACMPLCAAGQSAISVSRPNGCASSSPSSPTSNTFCSRNDSATLGKHSRDANFEDAERSEKCVLVPKTLRIDNPNEASRSPLWTTLGIEPVKHKVENNNDSDTVHIIEANPAAFSRSQTFQEST